MVSVSYKKPESITATASVSDTISRQSGVPETSVNEVVATSIAANVADAANLPIAANVSNLSVSLAAKNEITPSSTTTSVSKQQLVQPGSDRRELVTYTVRPGDTIDSVATNYGVSKDTIKWANNLTSDSLSEGKELIIPPVDGVVYTVKEGDTVEKLAEKYKASRDRIVAFNDLEIDGLKKDVKIVIPAGQLPETERPGYVAPTLSYYSTQSIAGTLFRGSSAGNGYAYGYCTFYAKNMRPDLPNTLGNANTWYARAAAMGIPVGSTPRAGAIFQTSVGGGGYGHAGYIESVDYETGTVTYSDMNGLAGWNRIGRSTTTIAEASARWNFIY
ncbi:hypothetical protein B7Y92_01000 [Candidatus Saccharibacteria bacterium 32-50-13]|nr:MAG: hypothetical protein B7Y92_01000 [Candidatus Saccharibacteria bacterium 32-50-13]